jgi:hypothetical protein
VEAREIDAPSGGWGRLPTTPYKSQIQEKSLPRQRSSIVEAHWPEVALSVVLLVATTLAWSRGRISADAVEIIDVITAALAIYIIALKHHIARTLESVTDHQGMVESRTNEISSILETLGGPNLDYAFEVVDGALDKLRPVPQGVMRLEPSTYYRRLADMLRSTKRGCHVSAVSSVSIDRWEKDPRQINYLQENLEAVKRGVEIRRVFLIDRPGESGAYSEHVRQIISRQREAKIKCYIVWRDSIRHSPELYEDFVLFDEAKIVFRDEHEKVDPTRVSVGFMITNEQRVQQYRDVFRSLSETYCADQKTVDALFVAHDAGR